MIMSPSCSEPTIADAARLRLIETGSIMQKRCWRDYQFSKDQKHADRAEWWRALTERSLNALA